MRAGPAQLWPEVAPQWILSLPEWLEEFCYDIYKSFIFDNRYEMYVEGLGNTLLLTAMATLMGIVLGVVIALLRSTWDKNGHALHGAAKLSLRIVNWLCNIYLTVIRGTPVVVQLLISFFILFPSAKDGTWVAILTFGVNSGAYVAEVIRSGIMAIDKGQTEAGRSLGFSGFQTMQLIILPQAFKNILPAIGNEMIALLKETSVAGYVAVVEITKAGNQIKNTTYDQINPILLVALLYLVMVIGMTRLLGVLERRLRNSER